MANDGTLNFDTKIDSSGFQNGLNSIGGLAKKGFAVTGKVLGAAATGITKLGGAAIKVGSDFETSFTKASTLFGDIAVDTDNLNAKILEMSSASGTAATELNETLYQAMSAGIPVTEDMKDALNAVDVANKLSVGGYTSASTAMGALTTAINAYKLPASDAVEISDQLITVQNEGVTTVDELASNMGKAIATGSAYGINLKNINAGYIALTKSGISTAESTTYMSAMFNELGKNSSTVGDIIQQKAGMSFAEFMAQGGSLADVMDVLSESVDGSSDALINLFGSAEAGKAANAIMQQGTDSFRQSLNDLTTSTGSTQAAYDAMIDTFGGQFSILQESAANLLTSLYENMQDTAKDVVKEASGMVQQLQGAFDEGGFEGLVGSVGDVLAQTVQRIAESAPMIVDAAVDLVSSFCEGLKNAPGIGESGASLITSIVVGLQSCAGEIWATAITLIGKLAGGIADGAPQMVQAALAAFEDMTAAIGKWCPLILQAGVDIIVALAGGIADAIPILISQAAFIITDIAMALVNNLPALVDAALQLVQGLVQGFVEGMPILLEGAIQLFLGILEALPVVIEQLLQALPSIITAVISYFTDNTPVIIDGTIQLLMGIIEAIPAIVEAIDENIPQILNAIAIGMIRGIPVIVMAAKDLLIGIVEAIAETAIRVSEAVSEIVAGITNGLISGVSAVKDAALELGSNILGSIKSFFGIHSPSTVMAEQGDYLVQGLINGIISMPAELAQYLDDTVQKIIAWGQQMLDVAQGAINGMISAMIALMTELPGKIWEWLVGVITKMLAWKQQMVSSGKKAISDMISAIISQLLQLPGKVTNELVKVTAAMMEWGADIVKRMTEVGSNIVSGIWNGISSGWDWLKEKVADLADSLLDGAKEALGINSPSTRFRDEFGRWLMPGAVEGVKRSMPKALQDMRTQAGELLAVMKGTVDASMGQVAFHAYGAAGAMALVSTGTVVYNDNHMEQENNYHEKVITPAEVNKAQREAFRKFSGGVK